MTQCYHYGNREKDETDGFYYCERCGQAFTQENKYSGTLTIGSMKTNFDIVANAGLLDAKALIEDSLRTPHINIRDVWVYKEAEYSYTQYLWVAFSLGNAAPIEAHFEYTYGPRYTEVEGKKKEIEVAEDIPTIPLAEEVEVIRE